MNKLNIKNRNLDIKPHELRSNGVIPGTIYGPTINNNPIKASKKELEKAIGRSGEVYNVMSKSGPVMVKFEEVQRDPVTKEFLHFSLVQLPQGVENEVDIPVTLTGTPVGVKKGGVLVVMKDEITLNGKPRSIPVEVEANISDLDIGDKLVIDDLEIPKKVDALGDSSEVVAICKPPVKEEIIEETTIVKAEDDLDRPSVTTAQAISF